MLYEIKNGTVSLGGNEILSHFYFRMVDGEKIGIVGRNGAGKTTLLKLMIGEIELDYNDDNTMGEIVKSKDFNPGYLRQQLAGSQSSPLQRRRMVSAPTRDEKMSSPTDNMSGHSDNIFVPAITVYSYLLEAFNKLIEMEQKIEKLTSELSENYDEKKAVELNTLIDTYNYEGGNVYTKELKTGFKKFGFSEADLEKPINEFSGGQSTKISLLKLLLSKPDVLMLDEPTNHLDIDAIDWMENYLKNYKGNVVVVSHDRMFLDNICNVIYDVENKTLVRYEGNYSDFVSQKEINYQLKLAEYNKNVKEIERLTALADRFRYKATKAKMVQSKDKVIEKLEAKTFKPTQADTKTFHVKIVPNKTGGREVLRCSELVVGYGVGSPELRSHELCERLNEIAKVNLVVNRGDRLAVIGANGTGKSTFIKTIVGAIPKISGDYSYGHEIEYEYFDQKIAENNSQKTLFDDFSDEFPTYDNTEVRNRLGRFLFTEEDIGKRVCDLSGGEKVRLALAKIFERKPNLLIFDEPTNHLDILGKESMEEIIDSFEGTVIFVSHDRYFVRKICTKVLLFERGIQPYISDVRFFEFGYEDYEKYVKSSENEDENAEFTNNNKSSDDKSISENKATYIENKQKNKDSKKLIKIEEEISKLEKEIEDYKELLENPENQSDFMKLTEIQQKIDETNKILEEKYETWESLQ